MTPDGKNLTINYDIQRDIDEVSIQIYEYLYGNAVSHVCYYGLLTLTFIVGPLLCSTIVFYEHFGADSQKRTIINRLCSVIFSNITICSIIWSIVRILRDALGLLPTHLVRMTYFCLETIGLSTVLFATELAIIRFLYIVIWKHMKTINDEFWMRFVAISTYLIALHLVLPRYLSVEGVFEVGEIIQIMHYEGRT